MSRLAYFDCFAGVSGDMILGALVDAGLTLDQLEAELALLDLDGYKLSAERVDRQSIAATRVKVDVVPGDQPGRTLADIRRIVEDSRLPPDDKSRIIEVFVRLAAAEAAVHGQPSEEVHFHDVGAVDAIVDIAGAIAGLRLLDISDVYSSGIPLGSGSVSGPHGLLPVPAPATLALLTQADVPNRPDPAKDAGELSTPTGAAILAAAARFERPAMDIEVTGYGAGGRNPEGYPNVLRVWIGARAGDNRRPSMLLMETNIDDMPAEQLAFAMDQVLKAGAADAWFTPIQMKKGRPGVMLSLLCSEDLEDKLAAVVLRETSTFGLRVRPVWRHEAEREEVQFKSSLGDVVVKLRRIPGDRPLIAPEFEACRAIALERGIPLAQVMETVREEAQRQFGF